MYRDLVFVHAVLSGTVMPSEPSAQAVQTGKKHPFGDIGLVQLVADLPFEFRRDDDFSGDFGALYEPVVQDRLRVGHNRKERILVYNPIVH